MDIPKRIREIVAVIKMYTQKGKSEPYMSPKTVTQSYTPEPVKATPKKETWIKRNWFWIKTVVGWFLFIAGIVISIYFKYYREIQPEDQHKETLSPLETQKKARPTTA